MFIIGTEVSSHSQMHTVGIPQTSFLDYEAISNFIFGGMGWHKTLVFEKVEVNP